MQLSSAQIPRKTLYFYFAINSLYKAFCKKDQVVEEPDLTVYEESDDTLPTRDTIHGQKEKEKQKENEKVKQQKAFQPTIERNPEIDDVKENVEFWDGNGFGFTNVNAKQQLLSWLDESSFLQPKEMILKAMNIACTNNKRRLNYIMGILKNWENESLLTGEEVDSYEEKQKPKVKNRQSNESIPGGRAIPRGFELDLTAGEVE